MADSEGEDDTPLIQKRKKRKRHGEDEGHGEGSGTAKSAKVEESPTKKTEKQLPRHFRLVKK